MDWANRPDNPLETNTIITKYLRKDLFLSLHRHKLAANSLIFAPYLAISEYFQLIPGEFFAAASVKPSG